MRLNWRSTISKQHVYRWKDGDVKIKLKSIEAKGRLKMAFYYSHLSTKVNEERLENILLDMYKVSTTQAAELEKALPLLDQ